MKSVLDNNYDKFNLISQNFKRKLKYGDDIIKH